MADKLVVVLPSGACEYIDPAIIDKYGLHDGMFTMEGLSITKEKSDVKHE